MKQNINVELLSKLSKTLEDQLKESRAQIKLHENEITKLNIQNQKLSTESAEFDVKYSETLKNMTELEKLVQDAQTNLQKQTQISERATEEVKKAKDGILYYRQEYQKELNEKKVLKDEITRLQINLETRQENKESIKVSVGVK